MMKIDFKSRNFVFFGILVMFFKWSLLPCQASDLYDVFRVSFKNEMSRFQVQQVLGDPEFIFYKNLYLKGFPEVVEICVSGYRITKKRDNLSQFVTLIFANDVQLAISIISNDQSYRRLFFKKIVKKSGIFSFFEKSTQGYFDENNRIMYLFKDSLFSETKQQDKGKSQRQLIKKLSPFTTRNIKQILDLCDISELRSNAGNSGVFVVTQIDLHAIFSVVFGKNFRAKLQEK